MRNRVSLGARAWSVEIVSQPLDSKGHDAFAVGARSVAIADGATPLQSDWPQDVDRFAARICSLLVDEADKTEPHRIRFRYSDEIIKIWSSVITLLRDEFTPAGHKRTAGAAVVLDSEDGLLVSVLGDVSCFVVTPSKVVEVTQMDLAELDEAALHSGDPLATFVENRSLANKAEGYPVVGDSLEAAARATTTFFLSQEVVGVVLITDGFRSCFGAADALEPAELLHSPLFRMLGTSVASSGLVDDATAIRLTPV